MKSNHILIFLCFTAGITFTATYSVSLQTDHNIIWKADFEDGNLENWEVIDDPSDEKSNWFIKEGYLIQDTDYGNTKELTGTNIINGSNDWQDYTLRANLICTDDDYIGILFRYNDINNYYRFLLSSERKDIRVDKRVNGNFVNLARYTEQEWPHVKFSVTIALNKNNIRVYLNEEEFFNINDDQFSNGKIGFVSISNLGSFFDDIRIYSSYTITKTEVKPGFTRGPYLQNIQGDSATIMWNTSLPMNSVVEYGLSPKPDKVERSENLTTLHEVTLKNLSSETEYHYRIRSGDLTGEWHSFKTVVDVNTPFSFIIYGDNQMNFLVHREIVKQFTKHNFDFLMSCGDVVQRGPRNDWDVEFFGPLKKILANKPIYSAIGNHEQNSENFYKNFSYLEPQHENYYSVKYGNSFFIFIDNPRAAYPDKTHFTDYKRGSKQYEWLESELSSKEAQSAVWLFVLSHVPCYVAGSQEAFPGCKEYLVPLFEKYEVDFSFSGHVHGYERGFMNDINYIVTAGGGGALNKKSSSKLKQYKGFKTIYNFCRLDVKGEVISVNTYDINNNLIDKIEIKK